MAAKKGSAAGERQSSRSRRPRVRTERGASLVEYALLLALIAVGVMNVPVMVGLALLIALEKQWRHGELLSRFAGVAMRITSRGSNRVL